VYVSFREEGSQLSLLTQEIERLRWYDYDDVLAVIPEPTKIESSYSHFKIDDEIWKSIQDEI
jgi:NADH pyrophosphatase NudC (nudix superfamily)